MKQLLCYGDSNTWGLIPGTRQRYPWGVRWTSILQEELSTKNIRVIEEGLCGRTTIFEDAYRENRNGLKMLPSVLETHTPIDSVVIMLGTNDCKAFFNLTAYQIAKGMEKCIRELLTVLPADKILLVSPIYLGADVWKQEFDPEFNKQSAEVSRELKYEYKRIAEELNVHMIAASDYAEASDIDQEHMNEKGHQALAKAISQALDEIIK